MRPSEAERQGIGAGSVLRRNPDGGYVCVIDDVTVEEPLEMRISQEPLAVTMRTPGNDEELAAGFLLSEAIVRRARICARLPIAVYPLPWATSLTSPFQPPRNSLQPEHTVLAQSRPVADYAERRASNSFASNFHQLIPRDGFKWKQRRFSICRNACVTLRVILPGPAAFMPRRSSI